MATFYLDYEGGDDTKDGTTFANRWKTITNGATAARIAPGDTIRIMASPDPVEIGTAQWTGLAATFVDSIIISSSTNATPIEITTSTDHGLVANDYVFVYNHITNTNAIGLWKVGTTSTTKKFTILNLDGTNTTGNGVGSGGSCYKGNTTIVKFSSPVVKNIFCGGLREKPAWTASANVTCTQYTDKYKEGRSCASIAVAAAFTTGKAAYLTLPSTLDLSSYQKVSFWVQLASGTVGADGSVYLALCTDTTGDTVAHQCNIPAAGSTNIWQPVVVDFGTNLNSAIRSIAFYVVTDNGAQTFYIDNIVACDSKINLTSLIGKNSTGNEEWYPLISLNYDVAVLGGINNTQPLYTNQLYAPPYWKTTESVTTYSRETIKFPASSSTSTTVNNINDYGSSGSPISFSGGWNRTDMSTQTGETWYDGRNGYGYAITTIVTCSYTNIDKLNFARFYRAIDTSNPSNLNFSNIKITACGDSSYVFNLSNAKYCTLNNIWLNNNNAGIGGNANSCTLSNNKIYGQINSSAASISFSGTRNVLDTIDIIGSNGYGFRQPGKNLYKNINISYCGNYAFYLQSALGHNLFNVTTTGNNSGSIYLNVGIVFANNCSFNESSIFNQYTGYENILYCNRLNNTDNNNVIYYLGLGTISQQTSVVDSPATTSWKMSPTTLDCTSVSPLQLKLGTIVCKANSQVTITARMRRNNTGLTMSLVCPGGQINGVDNDVSSSLSASADTWATVTITFTPSKPGAVDIYAYAYGGTAYNGYVCNLTASQ